MKILDINPWTVIHNYPMSTTLIGTHQVVVKLGHMYCLVYDNVIYGPGVGLDVFNCARNDTVLFGTEGWVISLDANWGVVVIHT